MNSLLGVYSYQTSLQNPLQVPLNGALKSTNIIVTNQQANLLNHPSQAVQEQALTGEMKGTLTQVPLSKK